MTDDIDKNLLHRLQALRAGPAGSQQSALAPQQIKIDVIERAKTPTREDSLAARLRSLRQASAAASPEPKGRQQTPAAGLRAVPESLAAKDKLAGATNSSSGDGKATEKIRDVTVAATTTADEDDDDYTLQELLADVTPDEELGAEGSLEAVDEEKVRELLERLADEMPKNTDTDTAPPLSSAPPAGDDDGVLGRHEDSDDSDGEKMRRAAMEVVDRCRRDEMTRRGEEAEGKKQEDEDEDEFQDPHDEAIHETDSVDLSLFPSIPSNLQNLASTEPKETTHGSRRPVDMDDIAARMAALRAPSHNTDGGGDDDDDDDQGDDNDDATSFAFPSVPTSRPSGKTVGGGGARRLETTTRYTDDDADGWCVVCLEDAALRCLGCDEDVYCARCWREMHLGSAAAFDGGSHRAVQFTRDGKGEKRRGEEGRKVALGA